MRASANCLRIVTKFEGYRPVAYLPTAHDVWTIGYGHTKGVKKGDTCTVRDAAAYLHDDLHVAEDEVNHQVHMILTQNQFDAVCSLVYNVGATPTLFERLNAGDFQGAAEQFDRWCHQAGKVVPGLVSRRAEERKLFETP